MATTDSSNLKITPSRLYINRGKWEKFSSSFAVKEHIRDFEQLGGRCGLLQSLWDNYEAPTVDTKEVRYSWKCIKTGIEEIQKYRQFLRAFENSELGGFDDKLDELEMIADTEWEYIHNTKGNKILWAKHYWVGALWPHLRTKDATRLWVWLTDWIQLIEEGRVSQRKEKGERLRQWANSVRRRCKKEIPSLHTTHGRTKQTIFDQLGVIGDCRRRDLMAISIGVLNTLRWLKTGKSKRRANEINDYLAQAYIRWPFFKNICPNISCISGFHG